MHLENKPRTARKKAGGEGGVRGGRGSRWMEEKGGVKGGKMG